MKTRFTLLFMLCFAAFTAIAQVTTLPAFVEYNYTGEVVIVFNPSEGNGGMVDAKECWAHSGVTIDGTNTWQYVPGSWRSYPDKMKMTKNADGNWELKITPNVQAFYGVPSGKNITGLSFVFNDGKDGSLEGKTAAGTDIFVNFIDPDAGLMAKIVTPSDNLLLEEKKTVAIEAAASKVAEMTLYINDKEVKKVKGWTLSYSQEITDDTKISLTATADDVTIKDSTFVAFLQPTVAATRPAGIVNGIYYNETDFTKATLCTYAASKTEPAKAVYVLGDFNNWAPTKQSQMKRDGNYFWLELENLEPEKEYAFQYMVIRSDGKKVRISDLFSEKLLHPDDKYEPKTVDPKLMDYPEKGEGYVSVLQTNKPKFPWSEQSYNFQRPDKNNLIIYELWIYDYTAERSLPGLVARLDYLKNLGVNAIELMPVCEFDGNYNWGYSPNHYFAPDRAYGSDVMLKNFIDLCHQKGIAVILDMVFNHATGLNPMNKLYPYGDDLKNNPWFCTEVPHDDNVYEKWNHDFEPARDMFTRALQYWIKEYRVDGYRMDLSHGLCGCGTKSTYDYNKLMDNIAHYYNEGVLAAAKDENGNYKNGEPYFILEHWGPNMGSQRPKLVSQGMLCWDNNNNAYSQLAMGYSSQSNISNANRDGYVSYCESHDEERNFYKAKTWGSGIVKTDEEVRLNRVPLTMAFSILLNGPQMIWQYNELGYDFSINSTQWTGNNKLSDSNRTSVKNRPDHMGWFNEGIRMQQYQKVGQIIQLRTKLMPELFAGDPNTTDTKLASGFVRTISWGSGENAVFAMGNFQPETEEKATLPAGTWYDYLAGGKEQAAGEITLKAGELRIFTGKKLELPQLPSYYTFFSDIPEIKQDTDHKWTVVPTVVTDIVNISGQPDAALYNISGQLLLRQSNVQVLDLSNLTSGMYLLKLTKDSQQQTVKLIKK